MRYKLLYVHVIVNWWLGRCKIFVIRKVSRADFLNSEFYSSTKKREICDFLDLGNRVFHIL